MSTRTNPLGRTTRKHYYEDYWLKRHAATVVQVKQGAVELDGTIAFPEGGGQEGDIGTLTTQDGAVLHFCDTKKHYGTPLFLSNFPTINVDTVVYHLIDEGDQPLLASLAPGDPVVVEIDVTRRARLTLSHTASHLVYMAIEQVRPDAIPNIRGCHIKEDSARFDFGVADRFQAEELEQIGAIASRLVERDLPIQVYPHPEEPEALYWECDGVVIPCGGTHLTETGAVGPLELRRRNMGKGIERILIAFPNPSLDLARYHE